MTDNPAVRAVAERLRVFVCEPTDEGGEMGVFHERHPDAEPRFDWTSREALALEALAALASSQEVKDWLVSTFERDHAFRPTEYDACWSLREVLYALGGGE